MKGVLLPSQEPIPLLLITEREEERGCILCISTIVVKAGLVFLVLAFKFKRRRETKILLSKYIETTFL
jgi:hypothetical protein